MNATHGIQETLRALREYQRIRAGLQELSATLEDVSCGDDSEWPSASQRLDELADRAMAENLEKELLRGCSREAGNSWVPGLLGVIAGGVTTVRLLRQALARAEESPCASTPRGPIRNLALALIAAAQDLVDARAGLMECLLEEILELPSSTLRPSRLQQAEGRRSSHRELR